MVKLVLAWIVPKLGGKTNLAEGMLLTDGIRPMGAGLHEPPLTCDPFVRGKFEVKQKLMKLSLDVRDATWPAAGTS